MPYYTYQGNLRDRNKFTSTVRRDSQIKRYFSSLDSEVYIGSTRIHEIAAIDFTISEPKLPIYGYNSFYANRIISGRRMVQGTFAINFTGVNYLLNILFDPNTEDSILSSQYDSLTYRCTGDDTTGLGIGNSDIFHKAFDLTISYGNGKSENPTYHGCYQTLIGVQIVEHRQALDTDGNPILDMYSFIAKDIRYDKKLFENTEKEEIVNNLPIEKIESPCFANKLLDEEMTNLTGVCSDKVTDGFIVCPSFVLSDDKYYISLYMDARNNQTKKFTKVSMAIVDQSKNINYTCTMKDIPVKSSSMFELKDSLRNIGVQLNKLFEEVPDYNKCQCTIKFTASIDNKDTELSYQTILLPGELL